MWKKRRIYADYASARPIRKEVEREMRAFDAYSFGNPSSLHREGLVAKAELEKSRKAIGELLGVSATTIIFLGSGTEANNLAMRIADSNGKPQKGNILISSASHPSLIEAGRALEYFGVELRLVPVDEFGRMDLGALSEMIDENTNLVSYVYGNSEIGTLERTREINEVIAKKRIKNGRPSVHIDASACPLYIDTTPHRLGADLLTLDGAKIGGPKGVGLLYVSQKVKLFPLVAGGGQEGGLRAGTENIRNAVGFAAALKLCVKEREVSLKHVTHIRNFALRKIQTEFPDAIFLGHKEYRLPDHLSVCIPNMNAEYATLAMDGEGVAVSYASACATNKNRSYSDVIKNLPKYDHCASSTLRLTFGRESKNADVDIIVSALKKVLPLATQTKEC